MEINSELEEKRKIIFDSQCYMYCLWEQFGLVDDKRELSLNGMLTFFQRIPAYRVEVQKAIRKCKGIGKYFGIYSIYFVFLSSDRSIVCFRISIERCLEQQCHYTVIVDSLPSIIFALHAIHRPRSFYLITDHSIAFLAKGDNCEYAYTFNKCYAEASPRVSTYSERQK